MLVPSLFGHSNPALHVVQLVSPGSVVYLPAWQSRHAVDELTSLEYFPGPHVVQKSGVDDDGAAFPIGQASQDVDWAVE
jgi:hypothetical protein